MHRAGIGWGVAVAVAVAIGIAVALLGAGATPTHAAGLPCGVLSTCTTTTTTTTNAPTPVTTTSTSPTQPAAHSPAVGGASYYGRTSAADDWSEITVAKDATQVSYVSAGYGGGRCSNGQSYTTGFGDKTRDTKISAGGVATYSTGWQKAYEPLDDGKTLHGREDATITLHFDGARATGSITDTFRDGGFSCQVTVKRFTLYEAGTAQAPLKTSFAETGEYIGTGISMHIYVPVEEASLVRFTATFRCSNGTTQTEPEYYSSVAMNRGRFHLAFTEGGKVTNEPGETYRSAESVSLALTGSHGLYTGRLTWKGREIVYKSGRQLTSCSGSQTFTATGP